LLCIERIYSIHHPIRRPGFEDEDDDEYENEKPNAKRFKRLQGRNPGIGER
jgi:hypothetical protein